MDRIAYDESSQKILWTQYDRGRDIEKHILDEIRAHLENPKSQASENPAGPEAQAPDSGHR